MEYLTVTYGYPVLFIISFLAATILPLGSEWLLSAMLLQGFAPLPTVIIATAGNYLGGCTTYLIGIYGGPFFLDRVLRIESSSRQKAERVFRKYGCWSLLFTWLPVVGDPLCLVGGLLRISFIRFSILVILGKFGRYGFISVLIMAGLWTMGN